MNPIYLLKRSLLYGRLLKQNEDRALKFANILRSWSFLTGDNLKADPITFSQRLETLPLNRGMMHEKVLAAFLLDKTKSFLIIEPFYFSF